MKQYPMEFKVHADSESGIQKNWTSFVDHVSTKIPVSIPPEFDGPGGGYSPEDLYALALQNCFVATFKVFAEKSRLSYEAIKTTAILAVDRNDKGFPWMARLSMKIELTGAQQKENALRILEKTSQNCMILNSVNTVKNFEYIVQ